MSQRIRVADLVARMLTGHGVRDVFMVTGGSAMHLNDALVSAAGLRVTCFQHEQAAAMAADGYVRACSRLAAVNVTSGPGATNAITGVLDAWGDSLPMVVLSGQVEREHLVAATGLGLRQLGDQEVDIVSMVSGITKYAVCVTRAETIRYHLERALYLAVHGRPGPVWIDLPVDVQGELVDADELRGYSPADDEATCRGRTDVAEAAAAVTALLEHAERPVLYAGSAIRSAGALPAFRALVRRLEIRVVTALNGHDLLDHADPVVVGRPGIIGDRAGNLAVQNADLLLVVGARLKIGQVGYDAAAWAPAAHVVMVDIDASELAKPTIHVETPVHADLKASLEALVAEIPDASSDDLPAAIGAAIAAPGQAVICLAGDGSVQLNIQELQTIVCR